MTKLSDNFKEERPYPGLCMNCQEGLIDVVGRRLKHSPCALCHGTCVRAYARFSLLTPSWGWSTKYRFCYQCQAKVQDWLWDTFVLPWEMAQ